jgi:hypothetical protein
VAAAVAFGSTFAGMWYRQHLVVLVYRQVAVSTDKEAHALPISIYRTSRHAESGQHVQGGPDDMVTAM